MMKWTSRLAALLLALLLLCLPAATAEDEYASTMRLAMTEGTFRVTDKTGNEIAVSQDMRLFNGYTVETGAQSYVWITLDDTKVCKLDENSSVRIEKEGHALRLNVLSGSLFFNVTEKLNDNESMEITTATMVTGIRGTSGEMRVEADGSSTFRLLDGSVKVQAVNAAGKATGKAVTLKPGETISSAKKADEKIAALSEVESLDAVQLCFATLAELSADEALQHRVDPVLVQAAMQEYERCVEAKRTEGNAEICIHDYPPEMQRTYTMNADDTLMTAKVTCALCNKELTETEPVKRTPNTAPTCTEAGLDDLFVHFIAKPFEDQRRTAPAAPLGHLWEKPAFTWGSGYKTCTVTVTCARDSAHTATVDALVRHAYSNQGSCTEPDAIHYTAEASLDGQTFRTSALVTVPGTGGGHSYGNPTFTWNDAKTACTATVVCANDASHTLTKDCDVSIEQEEPDCTSARFVYTASVTFPNGSFTDKRYDSTAHEHIWGEASYSWGAGNTSCTGTHTCQCDSGCGATESTTVSASRVEVIPATCEMEGTGVYVAVFPDGFTTQELEFPIPPLSHQWSTSYDWDGMNCTATAMCSACASSKTETATAVTITDREATCTQAPEMHLEASFSNPLFTTQTRPGPQAEPLGHTYIAGSYGWAADFSSCSGTFVCTRDTSHLVSLRSASVTSAVTKAPTEDEEGEERYTATFYVDTGVGSQTFYAYRTVAIPRLDPITDAP